MGHVVAPSVASMSLINRNRESLAIIGEEKETRRIKVGCNRDEDDDSSLRAFSRISRSNGSWH